jgi:hypothetical protein
VYDSSKVGEIVSEPAMLSNPLAESSGGSSVVGSISRSRRSRIVLAYSVRFNRCSTTDPGVARVAARSIAFSSHSRSASYSGSGGRGMSGGGMTPARSFRITFSQSSARSGTFARSSPSSDRFAVFSRSLWQVTQ